MHDIDVDINNVMYKGKTYQGYSTRVDSSTVEYSRSAVTSADVHDSRDRQTRLS